MYLPSSAFKKICKEFQIIQKHVKDCNIHIHHKYSANSYNIEYHADFTGLLFGTVLGMYEFSKTYCIPLRSLGIKNKNTTAGVDLLSRIQQTGKYRDEYILVDMDATHPARFSSLKMLPNEVSHDHRPVLIQNPPIEVLEGNYTYRILLGTSPEYRNSGANKYAGVPGEYISIISRNDDSLYDYLDHGFYVKKIRHTVKNKELVKHIVSPIYDVNAAHIFAMCCVAPRLTEMLQNGCFINPHTSELLRLKMHKKLSSFELSVYKNIADLIDNDYRSNSTIAVAGKLMRGEIEKTTINNVTFSKNSATYEQISIEATGLLDVLYQGLNFNTEFDIYTVISMYAAHVEKTIKSSSEEEQDKNAAAKTTEQEEGEIAEAVEEQAVQKFSLPSFKINNIDIEVSISATHQRYINNVRINKDEIAQAVHRASCHRSAEDYKLFLKSISRMSIKWHDIIANGLPVKIHSSITRDEYAEATPGNSAPALKFFIDPTDKYCKLQVNKDRNVRVHLGRLIKKIETLNKRTDGRSYYPKHQDPLVYYRRAVLRDYDWCAKELISILIDCCTFKKTPTEENAASFEVLISREDVLSLLSVVNEQKRQIIERSKQFLETTVKLTKAEKIEFLGKPAYKVQGSLRAYAVVIENAKVYDYESKQYRCIVNDRHYAGAGYDDIAARLLALKNDSMMQAHINTLKGDAQPFAERAHNDYRPERDVNDTDMAATVDKAFEATATNG